MDFFKKTNLFSNYFHLNVFRKLYEFPNSDKAAVFRFFFFSSMSEPKSSPGSRIGTSERKSRFQEGKGSSLTSSAKFTSSDGLNVVSKQNSISRITIDSLDDDVLRAAREVSLSPKNPNKSSTATSEHQLELDRQFNAVIKSFEQQGNDRVLLLKFKNLFLKFASDGYLDQQELR